MQIADTLDAVSLDTKVSENVHTSQLPLTNHDDIVIDVITDPSVVLDLLSSGNFTVDDKLDLQFI